MVSKGTIIIFFALISSTQSFLHVSFVRTSDRYRQQCATGKGEDRFRRLASTTEDQKSTSESERDNKAMSFLKKIGKVGGAANRDFRFAMGVDEGPAGKTMSDHVKELKKVSHAYTSCVQSGVLDNLSEPFPATSCGTRWDGFTDQVMGGVSIGNLIREEFAGRKANVLRGKVSLANNGGFIQMATNLVTRVNDEPSVDASNFEGVELEVYNGIESENSAEQFNIHIKTLTCIRPFSSYRASFSAPSLEWATVRIPFQQFQGKGPGAEGIPFDTSKLTRLGIVAIGKEMNVKLGLSGIRFY